MIDPLHLTAVQQAAAIVGSLILLVTVSVLIYRRALREDYGALWFTAALVTVIFAVWQDGLRLVAHELDAVTLTAPVFLLSILFLTAVAVLFSVRLSRVSRDASDLAREFALFRAEWDATVDDEGRHS